MLGLQLIGLVIRSAPVAGTTNLVANGDFSGGSTGWTTSPEAVISGGICTVTGGANFLSQTPVFTPGNSYTVTLLYTCTSGVNLRVRNSATFGGGTIRDTKTLTVDGAAHTMTFSFVADDVAFTLEADGGTFTGTIDNIVAN